MMAVAGAIATGQAGAQSGGSMQDQIGTTAGTLDAAVTATHRQAVRRRGARMPGLSGLALTAVGVVFGDIGTSPLYTLKTVLDLAGGQPDHDMLLGLLSLLVWTLIIITCVKYVTFVMRVDNDGEGGILALMSLLGVKQARRPLIVAVGLFGAALIYGDGAITPAISVLSALEGLEVATPSITPYVLPIAVLVLLLLFAIQPMGTARIGKLFGPVMTIWFIVIGLLGLRGVMLHPAVLAGLNPLYAIHALFHGGAGGFVVLGGVFLCVTGAEALYADMGHVGARPIRLAWFGLVLPTLVLNYAGQTGLLLDGVPAGANVFYSLCPPALLLPLITLATLATIIASQAIITGAFSMTRQAIQLGWCPRVRITQTSRDGYGQIYVGAVNWLLMLVTLGLTLAFGKSDNLAAAYGIAVSLTMMLTTILLFIAMREIWHWPLALALPVAGCFLVIDAGFVASNGMKIAEGGWVPLLLAVLVWGVMAIWHRGTQAVVASLHDRAVKLPDFLADIAERSIPRVPGTAVFLTRATENTPPVMLWHVKHNRALHQHLVAITCLTEAIPYVEPRRRMELRQITPDFWRIIAHYGFMERPDIPALLSQSHDDGCTLPVDDITYYVGHETVMHRARGKAMPLWQEFIFAFMVRNATTAAGFFSLPRDGVVEIGRIVEV
jgi:KUP system potassium uptake protein